jgi:hypothetical protein
MFQVTCTQHKMSSFVIISIIRPQATFIPLTQWWKLQPWARTQVINDEHETLAILAGNALALSIFPYSIGLAAAENI